MNKSRTKKYNTYKIKSGDTLLIIAEALGKESSEVIRFHNIFAKQEELISYEFPESLEFLYITPLLSEKHIDNIPKVSFLYDKKLALKPFKKAIRYEVDLKIVTKDITADHNCIMTVAFVEKKGEYSLFKIDRIANPEQVLALVMHEFMDQVTKVIYPLELVVTDYGNWIGIHNFSAISDRWQHLKVGILDAYEGNEMLKRLSFFDLLFKDEERVTSLLQKDVFLQTYFNNLYVNHSERGYLDTEIEFPILPSIKNVRYKVVQEVDEYVTLDAKIEIEKKGILNDARSALDYQYELDEAYFAADIPVGSYEAKYVLNSKNNTIENVNMHCVIELDEVKEIKIAIALVE